MRLGTKQRKRKQIHKPPQPKAVSSEKGWRY